MTAIIGNCNTYRYAVKHTSFSLTHKCELKLGSKIVYQGMMEMEADSPGVGYFTSKNAGPRRFRITNNIENVAFYKKLIMAVNRMNLVFEEDNRRSGGRAVRSAPHACREIQGSIWEDVSKGQSVRIETDLKISWQKKSELINVGFYEDKKVAELTIERFKKTGSIFDSQYSVDDNWKLRQ